MWVWLWALSLLILVVLAAKPVARRVVCRRLGPFRQRVNEVRRDLPERVDKEVRVAVIGGGLAGIAAGATLGRRGISVTLFEANAYLGGKVGSWSEALPDGQRAWVSHGYHAFFAHYYNLNRFLDSLRLRRGFRSVGDYMILERSGARLSFAGLERTPALNLMALARRKFYRFRDVLFGPARDLMGIFLEYDRDDTFERLDRISFAQFAEDAKLPDRLRLAFSTFSRAFFADEDRMSLAELVKCFHFYFLSHDGGLIYDYPSADYEPALLAPVRRHFEEHGAELRLSHPVERIVRSDAGISVGEETFDAAVVATTASGARQLLARSEGFDDPGLRERMADLATGQRYAVLRVWLNRPVGEDLPVFVITDRLQVLDAVAFYERLEEESAAWARPSGGGVIELHCYAVPDDLEEERVGPLLFEEAKHFLPELAQANVLHEALQVRNDFPAFHVGCHAERPEVDSGVSGLYFAGDWVKLDFPAMLMEGAFASGVVAANRILSGLGLREEPVYSVPHRGLMAGMPQPPARQKWLQRRSQ